MNFQYRLKQRVYIMPRKTAKSRANKFKKAQPTRKRIIPLKEDCQEYALVVRALGDRRYECIDGDGITRICRTRNTFSFKRENPRISVDAVVLVSLRDFDPTKGDIITIYSDSERIALKKAGHIHFKEKDIQDEASEEETILFEEEVVQLDFENI